MSRKSKTRKLRWVFLAVLILTALLLSTSVVFAATFYWEKKADMLTERNRAASGAVGGNIYVLGGNTQGGEVLTTVEMYDTSTNSWTTKNPLCGPRFAAACATSGNNIYIIGGSAGSSGGIQNTVLRYDTTANGGAGGCAPVGPGLVYPRFRTSAAALNGKIYVVGGASSGGVLDTIEEIDPATGQSVVKTTRLPATRDLAAVVAAGSKLYIIGGFNSTGQPTNTCWEYDPTGNGGAGSFVDKSPMLSARGGIRGAVGAGESKIYVCGGVTAMPPTSWTLDVQEYDVFSNSWKLAGSMPTSRYAAIAEVVNDRIYLIGGDNNQADLKLNECAYLQASDGDFSTTFSGTGEHSVNCGANGTVKVSFSSGTYINETLAASIMPTGPAPLNNAIIHGKYFDIATTGGLSGTITVTVPYDSGDPESLKLYHWNGSSWDDVTIPGSVDTVNHTIKGSVSSLSPFVVGESLGSSGGGFGMNTNLLALLAGLLILSGLFVMRSRRVEAVTRK